MPRYLRGTTFGIAGKVSWLDLFGKPVIRIGQLVTANTPNLVESKSLKLYLNGFANERIHSEEALVSWSVMIFKKSWYPA